MSRLKVERSLSNRIGGMTNLVIESLAAIFTYTVALGLLIFTLRRLVFSVAALAGRFLSQPKGNGLALLPSVTIAVAARDEEDAIGETLRAIARLDYPKDKFEVIMLDDCSRDRTPEIMKAYADRQPNFRYHRVSSSHNLGKAAALNAALKSSTGQIIYVLDADSLPEPGCVRAAVQHFADKRVGAVTGAPRPSERCSSFASYYAYLETLVHQGVTTRAKDILGLAPALFGSNCAYRRSALERMGGFKNGALLEDSDLVLGLYSKGYIVRHEPEAVSRLAMPKTTSSYFRQHSRWTRGFNDVLGSRGLEVLTRKRLSLPVRIELCLFSTGYLDRLFMVAGLALTAMNLLHRRSFRFPRWVLAASFVSPLVTIFAALLVSRDPLVRHWRLPLVPFFFAIDVLATLKGTWDSLAARPRKWHRVEREQQVLHDIQSSVVVTYGVDESSVVPIGSSSFAELG